MTDWGSCKCTKYSGGGSKKVKEFVKNNQQTAQDYTGKSVLFMRTVEQTYKGKVACEQSGSVFEGGK